MSLRGSPGRIAALTAAFIVALIAIAQPAGQPAPAASAARGARLFAGTLRFANGGPPCASCHSAAGIPFPNGGTLGPDLTTATVRFSEPGMQMLLSTLFFPTMNPVFQNRLLTPAEQSDLLAFLIQSSGAAAAPNIGWIFTTVGVLLAIALFLVTALTWRHRIRRVRRHLVEAPGVARP